jgi:hypothetical protein
MSFVISRGRTTKRKANLSDAYPQSPRCLKCFKYLLINPFTLCATSPGKKNYDRYTASSESYSKVSFS